MLGGDCVVAKAGAVVLANGNQCYKLMRRWASAGGEGIAAAYRAGAEMRGAEFGNFINWVFVDTKEVCQGADDVLYNAKGEHITKAIRPKIECDVDSKEVVAWWREMKAGNGPICANMPENYIMNVTSAAFHTDALAVRPISTAVLGPDHRQGHGRLNGQGPDAAGDARLHRRARSREGRPRHGDHRSRSVRRRRHVLLRHLSCRRRPGSPRPHARLGPRLRHVLRHALCAGGGDRGPSR